MKKRSVLFVVCIATMLFPTVAFAHGHHRGQSTRNISYALCEVEDCHISVGHRHKNTWYQGHSIEDGHDNHDGQNSVRNGWHHQRSL